MNEEAFVTEYVKLLKGDKSMQVLQYNCALWRNKTDIVWQRISKLMRILSGSMGRPRYQRRNLDLSSSSSWVQKGIDKLTINKKGDDVYCEAINTGRENILRAFMSHGVNPVTKKCLYNHAINKKANQLIPLLKTKGIRPTDLVAALQLAIREGSLEGIRELYTNKPMGRPLGFLHEAVKESKLWVFSLKEPAELEIVRGHDRDHLTVNAMGTLKLQLGCKAIESKKCPLIYMFPRLIALRNENVTYERMNYVQSVWKLESETIILQELKTEQERKKAKLLMISIGAATAIGVMFGLVITILCMKNIVKKEPELNITYQYIQLLQVNEFAKTHLMQCSIKVSRTITYYGMHSHSTRKCEKRNAIRSTFKQYMGTDGLKFGTASVALIGIIIIACLIKILIDTVLHSDAIYSVYRFSIHLIGSIWNSETANHRNLNLTLNYLKRKFRNRRSTVLSTITSKGNRMTKISINRIIEQYKKNFNDMSYEEILKKRVDITCAKLNEQETAKKFNKRLQTLRN
ncbi:hypothetical protein TSAR_011277 [Trichomalopsis sarcophagae]|uniref:Uncharacterized protein n=1 Tax=Trichomalopsis sarcophagae TaxID=543379 RepID=A0A232EK29_9HYME|nr:hypothetical protein TSAR_011277 [Trichomalopsis sarcophagae]